MEQLPAIIFLVFMVGWWWLWFKLFKKIVASEKDDDIEELLKNLYDMKGAKRLLKLDELLEEDQKSIVEKLLEIAMSN